MAWLTHTNTAIRTTTATTTTSIIWSHSPLCYHSLAGWLAGRLRLRCVTEKAPQKLLAENLTISIYLVWYQRRREPNNCELGSKSCFRSRSRSPFFWWVRHVIVRRTTSRSAIRPSYQQHGTMQSTDVHDWYKSSTVMNVVHYT